MSHIYYSSDTLLSLGYSFYYLVYPSKVSS
jgi:hypothetical protein